VLDSPRSLARGDGLVPDGTLPGAHDVVLELFAAEDAAEIAAIALAAASRLLTVSTASLWVPVDDQLECRAAVGVAGDRLKGVRIPAVAATSPIEGTSGHAVLAAEIVADDSVTAVVRVSRSADDGNDFTDTERTTLTRLAEAAGAAMSAVRRLDRARDDAAERERELAVISAMSREIAATLDLDRVLRSAVNLAGRVINFDRCAIALYERGNCDIRALAGSDGVDAKSAALQDLAVRAAWAAGRGEAFYLSDRADPGSDAERMFVRVFRADLERDRSASVLYLPLKDDEGVIGILLFEAERVDFASDHQRDLAAILANQTTVAVRNAQLYRQVPLADALGALAARKQALLSIPRRRRLLYGALAVALLAAATLIQWPFRVPAIDPGLLPTTRTDSIEVELGIPQEEITRVQVGDAVRLRVSALPTRTFRGRVTTIASAAIGDAQSVRFPVRATIANDSLLLRPGMTAFARVLTKPASLVERVLRRPARTARLLWWRMWS